jgi:hypothetical protein
MKVRIGKISLLLVFASLAFSGCFSPWKGSEAVLTLLLGTGPDSRAAAVPDDLAHIIELRGPTGRQSHTVKGDKLSVTVMPGYWEISVKAFLDGKLYAEGSGGADIKAGRNNQVEIKMNVAVGGAGIIINFLEDYNFTISRSDPGKYPQQFTAEVPDGFKDIQWFIWGSPISGENTITIKAEDYNPGTYQLTVMVIDENGVPYSAGITFEVVD